MFSVFPCSLSLLPSVCLSATARFFSLSANTAPFISECLAAVESICMVVEEGRTVCIEFSVVPLRAAGTVGFDVVSLVVGVFVSLHENVWVWDWDLVNFLVLI